MHSVIQVIITVLVVDVSTCVLLSKGPQRFWLHCGDHCPALMLMYVYFGGEVVSTFFFLLATNAHFYSTLVGSKDVIWCVLIGTSHRVATHRQPLKETNCMSRWMESESAQVSIRESGGQDLRHDSERWIYPTSELHLLPGVWFPLDAGQHWYTANTIHHH